MRSSYILEQDRNHNILVCLSRCYQMYDAHHNLTSVRTGEASARLLGHRTIFS